MKTIATVRSCYPEKFGIPRQSGLVEGARARLVFEPEFNTPDAVRGLEGFSHIWLIWLFNGNPAGEWSPTVRPPRLGGNKRMGVFATRSPFRPNPVGLSAVRLEKIEFDSHGGPILHLDGADLMDGTPVIDIKPYIPYADSIPDALPGFAAERPEPGLHVTIPDDLATGLEQGLKTLITDTLALDPRPSYHEDPLREYGMAIGTCNVRFTINGHELLVTRIERR